MQGISSILIAPSGEVYTCLTAYSYKDTDYWQNYKICSDAIPDR